MEKQETSGKKPRKRSRAGIVLLVILLILVGAAGYLYYSVVKAPMDLDDPHQLAASAPMSAEDRFRFSAADRTVSMKIDKADLWKFVLDYAGTDFMDTVNRELSAASLSVSGCGLQIDETGPWLNLELYYQKIRLVTKVYFTLEASGQNFCLKPTGVKLGFIDLPVADMLSSVKLELDFQVPVISHITGISYEQDALVISGSMQEDIRFLTSPEQSLHRIALFEEFMQTIAAAMDTEEGYVALLAQLEQDPGAIEDVYRILFAMAGPEVTQEYLDSHRDFTWQVLPGIDESSLEAMRTEELEKIIPLYSILNRFFASVLSDYNGDDLKISDGEFLKKLKPFHPNNYGGGNYISLYEVLDTDSFFLVLVDVENGYTQKTPALETMADQNQQFTQPVDFGKSYGMGFVFRGVGGAPFLLYQTERRFGDDIGPNLTLRVLSEEAVAALQVPGKIGVWTE